LSKAFAIPVVGALVERLAFGVFVVVGLVVLVDALEAFGVVLLDFKTKKTATAVKIIATIKSIINQRLDFFSFITTGVGLIPFPPPVPGDVELVRII
jgi:hypothetical protein